MSDTAKYELYRVITDYEALQDGFLDRIEDLNTTFEQIEMAVGWSRNNVEKLLRRPSPNAPRAQRTFGWESLGKMLQGTGLALVLVVDDERFAPVREQLEQRRRPRPSPRPTWLFTRKTALEMCQRRYALMSPAKRKRLARKAAKARWSKRKHANARDGKQAQSGGLNIDSPTPRCANGQALTQAHPVLQQAEDASQGAPIAHATRGAAAQ